jgi:hypothetical protein
MLEQSGLTLGGGGGRQVGHAHPFAGGLALVHPRLEIGGRVLGKRECDIAHVPLGVDDQRRNPAEERLFNKVDSQTGFS